MLESFLTILFSAVLGACLGSFANVVAIRTHLMVSLMGRSMCPACKKALRPRHMVPILSWLALRGKCADCGAQIHIQYPTVELVSALLVVIAAIRNAPLGPDSARFAFEVIISLGLVVMVVMDLRWKELPVELMAGLGILGIVFNYFFFSPFNLIFAVSVGVAFFGIQWLLSQGAWLGSGDVWFGGMMGLILGSWQLNLIAIYLAYVAGGFAVALLLLAKKIKRGMSVPFAPALAIGLMLALWFGAKIQAWLSYAF